MEKKQLNEREKLFIELLFSEETGGNAAKAKVMAGYAPTYATSELVKRLKDEIFEATQLYFSQVAPRAAMKITGVLESPADIGNKEVLAAAKDLLDRAGLSKVEKMEVRASGGVLILPAKDAPDDE